MSLPSLQASLPLSTSKPAPSASVFSASPSESFSGSLQRAMLSAPVELSAKPPPAPSQKSPPASANSSAKSAESNPGSPTPPPAPDSSSSSTSSQSVATQASEANDSKKTDKDDKKEDQSDASAANALNPNLAFLLAQPLMAKVIEARSESGPTSKRGVGKADLTPTDGADATDSAKAAALSLPGLSSTEVSPQSAESFKQALISAQSGQRKENSEKGSEAASGLALDPSSAAALALAASGKPETVAQAASSALTSQPLPLAQGSDAFANGAATVMTRMGAAGETRALVQVSPEALGPIKIEISMSNDASKALSVNFSAADDRTTALLQDHLNRLSDTLGSMGWQLKEVKATTDASLGQQSSQQGSQQSFSGSSFDGSGQRQNLERDQRSNDKQGQNFGQLVDSGWVDRSAEFAERSKGRDSRSNFDFYA